MLGAMDDIDDFHIITDQDFAKYPFKATQGPWKPLSGPRSIRLLKIFPSVRPAASDEETIECRLEDWNLDQASGKYEALSYAWGEPGNGFAYIQCDHVTMRIWRNLYQALRRLRDKINGGKTRQTRLIWVDALCIDQTNMLERQQQILLMKKIFGSASQVLIWLGEHDKASHKMWQSVKGVQPGSSKELIRNAIQWNVKMQDSFIRRPWFRRLWTLQEAVLSSKATFLCGDDEMDWTMFCTIWKARYEFMKSLKPEIRESRIDHIQESLDFIGLMNCFDIHQRRFDNSDNSFKTLPLSEIIIRTWYRDAKEAHDRIYALLGLIDLGKYAGLEMPDYSQSPLELFINVTKTAMRVDGMPALLNIAGISPDDSALEMNLRSLIHRPSWVPDWRKHGWENNWLTARLASDDSNARMRPDADTLLLEPRPWIPIFEGNRLVIRGHIVGHLFQPRLNQSLPSHDSDPPTFKVAGLSWGSSGQLRWVSRALGDKTEHTILRSRLPYDGETTKEGDVVCALEGIRSLFLVRMMFPFDFGEWGALEWLKEDVTYRGLELNCLLIGPVFIDDVELMENPSLGDGHWSLIIN